MDIFKKLETLGYTVEIEAFGITVFSGGRIVFHGREHEVRDWLKQKGEL